MILSSFSSTFCGPGLFHCWSRLRSDHPRNSRVRLKCYLLTSAVCVSMLSLQDNRQASINNRQLHRALKRTPPLPPICHRSSLALSRLVPRLSEMHTTRANKPFHQPQPVCGFQHPSIVTSSAVVTCILIKLVPDCLLRWLHDTGTVD